MPALRLFGRKWLAASDDLVFPGLFEIFVRTLWLILIVVVHVKYYEDTWECTRGGDYVRTYIIGMMALLSLVIVVLVALVNRSAKGSITDEEARKLVPPILLLKLFLIIPETVLNVFGTMWAFCKDLVVCPYEGHFSRTVIEALVVFNWALFGLAIFGLALVFDPLGSRRYHEVQETPSAGESLRHRKVTSLWQRRFRWAFCWVKSDEHGHEAFQQVAALLSALFRSTDLVPSDILAGCVLLRVKQKRETREMRRIQMLSDDEPKYSTDLNRIFAIAPRWMNLENARHFLRLSMAAYGWPFVMYRYCGTGLFRLMREVTCCSCFRPKRTLVTDDNCCLCHLAGVKYMSKIREDDILFASFRNHVFELPFCVIADHKTSNIVIAIRGSISLRDMFTDLTATSEKFEAEGLPPDTMAHKGMVCGANYVARRLKEVNILDKALEKYPEYGLVLTGHSLGAGVACLLALKIRHKYPDLKVYAFSTPAGLLSRDAARLTENFVFTVGVGDDFVMRLGVDSIENLRTGIIQTLHASRLPKYRILLNGFGYALFGVPSRDLETTWRDEMATAPGRSPLLNRSIPTVAASTEAALLSRDICVRRFSKTRLFTAGRILHIVSRKKTKAERKAGTGGPSYEMRWATAEDFMELKVMPRMLLDHLPENVYKTLDTVLREQRDDVSEII
ncbi:diacylglycerol lipase-beta [Tribolium castaneum]|uniref:sn-1-specific diacylglycerol lipase n=1 Tax=Tribolium castaneum TaxID=7070 RepID=D6X1S2_TRICA|nr:PREDICTED: sn1-specific diacylglycerol lipase beta [Tribolium castaneum]EFA10154.1 Sn1-specific diacylglycerol lipase beta-like Protein [Tribolium castaneum]|eukprot:XP_968775.1 PREDICTED: sn1-specific diacylglycerol lipase beta [Tribolium castaneum]